MACGITDPLDCVKDVAGGVGKQVAGDVFDEIAQSFATAAEDATKWLWNAMGQATAVHFGGAGWDRDIGITVSLALLVGVGLFLIQVVASGLRQDFGGMGRAVRGMFIAWGAGGAAITITESLLYVADQLSQGIMQVGAGTSTWEGFGQKILAASTIATVAGPEGTAAVILLIALVIVAASVIVWAALMIRKLLLIVAAVFAPVAFSGAQADITASWVRKWIEMTVALVASKVILVIIFVVGLGVLDEGVGEAQTSGVTTGHVAQTATQVVIGALILCMAGFAPWLALKMVHFAGDSFHAIHAHAQGVGQGARTAAQVPQKFRSAMQRDGQPSSGSSSNGGMNTSSGQPQTKPDGTDPDGSTEDSSAAAPSPGGSASVADEGAVAGEGAMAGETAAAGPAAAAAAPVVVAEAGKEAAKQAGQRTAETANDVQDQMSTDQGPPSSPKPPNAGPPPTASASGGRAGGEPRPSSAPPSGPPAGEPAKTTTTPAPPAEGS
jgi:type IV secretion system protein TrbL